MEELDLTQFKDLVGNLGDKASAFDLEAILEEVKGAEPELAGQEPDMQTSVPSEEPAEWPDEPWDQAESAEEEWDEDSEMSEDMGGVPSDDTEEPALEESEPLEDPQEEAEELDAEDNSDLQEEAEELDAEDRSEPQEEWIDVASEPAEEAEEMPDEDLEWTEEADQAEETEEMDSFDEEPDEPENIGETEEEEPELEQQEELLPADQWRPKYQTNKPKKHFWDQWQTPSEPEVDDDGRIVRETEDSQDTEENDAKGSLFSHLFRTIEEDEELNLPEEELENDTFQQKKSKHHFWEQWLMPDVSHPEDSGKEETSEVTMAEPAENAEEPSEIGAEPQAEMPVETAADESETKQPPLHQPEPPTISEEEFRAFMAENTADEPSKTSFEQLIHESGTAEKTRRAVQVSEETEDEKHAKTQVVYVDLSAKHSEPVHEPAAWMAPKKTAIVHREPREFPEPKWLHLSIDQIAEIAPEIKRRDNEPVLLSEIRHMQREYEKNRQKKQPTVRGAQPKEAATQASRSSSPVHTEPSEDGGDEDGGIWGQQIELSLPQEDVAPQSASERREKPAASSDGHRSGKKKKKQDRVPSSAKAGYQEWNRVVRSTGRRSVFVGLLTLVAVYLSCTATTEFPLPPIMSYGFHPEVYFSVLMALAVISMIIAWDVVRDGLLSLARRRPDFCTLVVLTLVMTIVHSAVKIVQPGEELTYPCVAMASLLALMRARMAQAVARRNTYKTVAEHAEPMGVYLRSGDNPCLVKRRLDNPQEFVMCAAQDAWNSRFERLYTPIVSMVSLVIALIITVATKEESRFLFTFSALLAAACQLGVLTAVAFGCRGVTRRLSRENAALAGLASAIRVADTPQIVLTEDDLFPTGSMRMDDYIDLRGTMTEEEVLAYAAAVEADSAVGKVLREKLRCRYGEPVEAEAIMKYDNGGRRARIDGKDVVVGTAAYMNDQKIPIPSLPNEHETLFLAVDGTTQAVFEIEYSISNPVYSAMQALADRQISVLFQSRDCHLPADRLADLFGVQPGMIQLPEKERDLTESDGESEQLVALLTRDSAGVFADCVDAACSLCRLSAVGAMLGTAAAVLGMLLMAYLCFVFAPLSGSPVRMLLYSLLWFIPIYYMENETKHG